MNAPETSLIDCPGGTSEKQTTAAKTYCPKGQLNSKCPFGVFKSTKKTNEIFVRISALATTKRSTQKSSVRESK